MFVCCFAMAAVVKRTAVLVVLVVVLVALVGAAVDGQQAHSVPGLLMRGPREIQDTLDRLHATRVGETDWEKCIDVPVLGETCLELYVMPANLTIGVRLLVRNHTVIDESLNGSHLCVDDKTLLEMLTYIPALLPFKKILDDLIKLYGLIPANVFSVCLDFTDLEISKTEVKGCAQLDSTLLCLKGKCVYKGTDHFGCFDIPL